jgi:hypothetical protein
LGEGFLILRIFSLSARKDQLKRRDIARQPPNLMRIRAFAPGGSDQR